MNSKLNLLAFIFCLLLSCNDQTAKYVGPPPTKGTIIKLDMEDGNKSSFREAWFDQIHRSDPNQNWKLTELKNSLKRSQKWSQGLNRSAGDIEDIGDGLLSGIWHEKGSNNQAGNVMATAYYPEQDEIFTVASGGSIFKSKRGLDNWEVVHEHLVFDQQNLEIITFNNQVRLIATAAKVPMYSDDIGETWKMSTGVPIENSNANTFNLIVLEDENPILFLQSKRDTWSPINIYKSLDGGITWNPIRAMGNSSSNKFRMTATENGNDLFLFDNVDDERTDIYQYDGHDDFALIQSTLDLKFGGKDDFVPTNAQVILKDDQLSFYTYAAGDTVKVSYDTCASWVTKGKIPIHPWNKRFFAFPSDPNNMFAGGVELFRSADEGMTWDKQYAWWEYYDNVENAIHADMMYFREFYNEIDEEYFTLISNHGGMSMTTDYGLTTPNISLSGLNVCQYYSTRTDPILPNIMYAGAQDQGFQRGVHLGDDEPSDFTQLISGDYGHIVFSENGKRLWTVYPFGSISYYNDPRFSDGPDAWFDIESDNEPVWLPPMIESPFKEKNEIYVAGGSLDGGPGSFMMRIEYENGFFNSDQFDFDFLAASGGHISAMAFSPQDSLVIYVGTETGRFYTSTDGGKAFSESNFDGPTSQYLYGNAIYVSKVNDGTVYYGGSGYSNAPVFISTDFGQTFEAYDYGLPPTLITGLTANDEETLLFASTESGPYVLDTEEGEWFSMAGANAPSTRYWSVEFLSARNRVRFGTYGRGIWDFEIMEAVSVAPAILSSDDWKVYPNPATDFIQVEILGGEIQLDLFDNDANLHLTNMEGKVLKQIPLSDKMMNVPLSNLSSGQYLLHLKTKKGTAIKQFIKH